MPEVTLNEHQQIALRTLLGAAPSPGRQLPSEQILTVIADLIECDRISSVLVDAQGTILDRLELPPGCRGRFPGSDSSSTEQFGEPPRSSEPAGHSTFRADTRDVIAFGFRVDRGCSVQLRLDRSGSFFSEKEVAVLTMISPAVLRLMRERPIPQLTPGLTLQERRVLTGVAAGKSNAAIAAELFVASSTVRKHLEHAFRKLGVNSRLAAVAILEGRRLPDHNVVDEIRMSQLANTPNRE